MHILIDQGALSNKTPWIHLHLCLHYIRVSIGRSATHINQSQWIIMWFHFEFREARGMATRVHIVVLSAFAFSILYHRLQEDIKHNILASHRVYIPKWRFWPPTPLIHEFNGITRKCWFYSWTNHHHGLHHPWAAAEYKHVCFVTRDWFQLDI